MEIYRSQDEMVLYSANVTMKKATIPFASIERQEIQLITDPKNRTRMPWESLSSISGGQIFFAKWEKGENYDSSKVINKLPVDQNFKTIARIYGSLKGSDGSNVERYIIHDCPLRGTNTNKWQCVFNHEKTIESRQLCDGHNDCCEEATKCTDESDEDPGRCKGANNKMIVVSKFVNITLLVLGYILSIVHFPIGGSKKKWTPVKAINKANEDCNAPPDLDHETFKEIFRICKKFTQWNNSNDGSSPKYADLIDITKKYKFLCETKDFQQIRALKRCLMNFSLTDSFRYTSMVIAEHLIDLEHEEVLIDDGPEEANSYIHKATFDQPKIAEFFIQSKERNDFLPRMRRKILTKSNLGRYGMAMIAITLLSTIFFYGVQTIIPYYDSHLDASLSIALHHIETYFITSDSKEKEIAFISLTITKYYYFLVSILSTICIAVLFYVNLPQLKKYPESLLYSRSKVGNIATLLAIIFRTTSWRWNT